MARVLISGGGGFIGSHLCDRMLRDDFEVIVVDNFITGRRDNLLHLIDHPNLQLIEHDISEPFDYRGQLDYIMHLASPASPPDFTRIPVETMRAGSYATHIMLELASRHSARFFLASTSEVYGDPPPEHHPQREDYWGHVNPIGLRSVYDEAKRYAEALTMAYHRMTGLETRIVRIFNTYGPRMRPDDGRVVTNLICQALRGEPLTVYGDGTQTRSFCYVTDMVEGFCRMLLSNEQEPVNLGNPTEHSIRELAELVIRLTGSTSLIVNRPLLFEDDPKQRRPDIAKAQQTLGWTPQVSLEEGLTLTIQAMREEILVQPSRTHRRW